MLVRLPTKKRLRNSERDLSVISSRARKSVLMGRDSPWTGFGLAILVVMVAAALTLRFPGSSRPYYLFLGASAFATWYGGWKPGALSSVLGAVLAIFCNYLPSQETSQRMPNLASYVGFLGVLALIFALSASVSLSVSRLKRLRLLFGDVVHISEDAIISIDERRNITLFNSGAEKIFGYTAADVLGKSISILIPERIQDIHKAQVDTFVDSSAVFPSMDQSGSISGRRKDGAEFPAEATISKFVVGNMTIVTIRFRDISERLAAEREVRRLAAIVESSVDAIISEDLDGIILSWNPGAEKMYGYTSSEALGRSKTMLLPPGSDDEVTANLQRARAGVSTHYETVRLRQNGELIHVDLNVSPILDKRGVLVGAATIAHDKTERRRLEQLLNHSQKMEAVGHLAGGVAHDFNNLLCVILGYADLINSSGSANEQIRDASLQIADAAQRGSALTRQLLAFGRQQIMVPQIIDLSEIAEGLGKMIPRLVREDICVRIVKGEGLKRVKADPSQVEQVIMNLVVNARDAMPVGGKLTIEISNVFLDEFESRTQDAKAGDYVLLSVSDTGQGMSDETRSHIFEPFFTTKEVGKGTGLGLATVYGIVRQSQGFIRVHSELGGGSVFKIYLPATTAPLATEQQTIRRKELTLCGSETILLVEDQEPLLKLFAHILRHKGYRVLTANCGSAALLEVAKHTGPVDLLLTDVILPGMRGNIVADALINRYPHMGVIYMSGYTDHAFTQNGSFQAPVNFLEKPFGPDEMVLLVRDVLNEPATVERYRPRVV